mmetsp:Transcript_37707/g.102511  ORF Transcript_37707/g.102511 Transcript_37707/m.102511 type:complete len:232 (-) Transcript_37707:1331-2026(-)
MLPASAAIFAVTTWIPSRSHAACLEAMAGSLEQSTMSECGSWSVRMWSANCSKSLAPAMASMACCGDFKGSSDSSMWLFVMMPRTLMSDSNRVCSHLRRSRSRVSRAMPMWLSASKSPAPAGKPRLLLAVESAPPARPVTGATSASPKMIPTDTVISLSRNEEWMARSARSVSCALTTVEIFLSSHPCAIATILMRAFPSALKKRPATPCVWAMPSPTAATIDISSMIVTA